MKKNVGNGPLIMKIVAFNFSADGSVNRLIVASQDFDHLSGISRLDAVALTSPLKLFGTLKCKCSLYC